MQGFYHFQWEALNFVSQMWFLFMQGWVMGATTPSHLFKGSGPPPPANPIATSHRSLNFEFLEGGEYC